MSIEVSYGVAVANADVMSWSLPAAPAAHAHDAITAHKRRTAAGSVASVNRGTT